MQIICSIGRDRLTCQSPGTCRGSGVIKPTCSSGPTRAAKSAKAAVVGGSGPRGATHRSRTDARPDVPRERSMARCQCGPNRMIQILEARHGVISYGVISYGVISYGVISYGVISYGVISYGYLCVISYGVISYGVISYGVILYGVILYGVILYGAISYGVSRAGDRGADPELRRASCRLD